MPGKKKDGKDKREKGGKGEKKGKKAGKGRASWLDAEGGIAIDEYAQKLTSFLKAVADGVVTTKEVAAQERRVVELMQEIEPALDDGLHDKVTRLLCELTAYDIMQMMHSWEKARPKVEFRG